jgi:hypothetical protein
MKLATLVVTIDVETEGEPGQAAEPEMPGESRGRPTTSPGCRRVGA